MQVHMLKSKIHQAVVTEANLNYIGSITIDIALMEQANLYENEKVEVADINNGNRFSTYIIAGERNSRIICLNGAAARMVQPGDQVIIMSYCILNTEEISDHKPVVLFMDKDNRIVSIKSQETPRETAGNLM